VESLQIAPRPGLSEEAEALLQGPEAEGAVVGAFAVDARTGERLFGHREQTRLLPASTLKIATTAAALAALGPDFRFRTRVLLRGARTGELFEGQILAEAAGDPSLGSWRFPETDPSVTCDRIARAIAGRGIKKVKGGAAVQGGEVAFDSALGPGWAWEDIATDFSAPPTGFVFHENVVDLRLTRKASSTCEPGAVGARFEPPLDGLAAEVVFENGGPRTSVDCVRDRGSRRTRCAWRAAGPSCPSEAALRVSVDEPVEIFASCVSAALSRAGVAFSTADSLPRASSEEELVTLSSPALRDLVRATNKESLNLYAERLAMRVARERTGREGYAVLGAALAEELVSRGVDPRDLNIADGSGLSRYNLVTARALARVLTSSMAKPYGAALVESLPLAGVDGTLASYVLPEGTRGRVRAKSGALGGQRAFVGVAERPLDPAHPRVVFALLLSNLVRPTVPHDRILATFAEILVHAPLP
jgi:D-alanyl-D-alanine carboxypeptidase/D-alanyl-D-alanine-endopeptidase (penicillin-binding protein 4)